MMGDAEGWAVMADPTLGDGCLIQREFTDGSTLRMGFDELTDTGYVAAFNAAWGDIEDGAEYAVTMLLDGEPFDLVAVGLHLNGVPGAVMRFDERDFIDGISEYATMVLATTEGDVMAVELEGSDDGRVAFQ